MKRLVSWCVIVQAFGLIYADFDSVMTLNHPGKHRRQAVSECEIDLAHFGANEAPAKSVNT